MTRVKEILIETHWNTCFVCGSACWNEHTIGNAS